MDSRISNHETTFWFILMILFLALSLMHFFLFLQHDLIAPTYSFSPIKTFERIAVIDDDGNFVRDSANTNRNLMIDPMNEFSNFASNYAEFINNDFSAIVVDINKNKRVSNLIACAGYFLAAIPCLVSLIISRSKNI
jgi:hypothetical protein